MRIDGLHHGFDRGGSTRPQQSPAGAGGGRAAGAHALVADPTFARLFTEFPGVTVLPLSCYPDLALSSSRTAKRPRYRMLRELASGGIADVFLAEGVVPGRGPMRVALKRLRSDLSRDPLMVGMFADEIRLGRLCSHPNLVATLDDGEQDGQPFVVLELVEGTSLLRVREALRAKGERFDRAQAVHVAMELCKGLSYLHALKDAAGRGLAVVHRDVTPPNVLLGDDGCVKLCDLGFAKWARQVARTEPGVIKGKFSYLSPEAAWGQPIDQRSDCYGVGIMLWEMLTMRRLFDAPTDYDTFKLAQRAEIPTLASRGGDADEVLEQIVIKCLARRPQDRFKSAAALHDALAAYADWQELSCDLSALVRRCRPAAPVEAFAQAHLEART